MKNFRVIPFLQAVYYFLTAVWPFIHLESFLWVTGPKTDIWLVKTVSLLLLPYTLLLLHLTFNSGKNRIIVLSMLLCCLGLIGIDVYYTLNKVIKWVYLIDGFLQALFFIYWLYWISKDMKRNNEGEYNT